SRPYGTAELLAGVVARARKLAADSEREDVAAEVRNLVGRSGLSKQDFAERIGTSRSRLSTYMSGKVVPLAALMVRMRRVALQASETVTHAAGSTQVRRFRPGQPERASADSQVRPGPRLPTLRSYSVKIGEAGPEALSTSSLPSTTRHALAVLKDSI